MRLRTFCLAVVVAVCSSAASARAEILARYDLGETGSVGPKNIPLDTVGGHNFLNALGTGGERHRRHGWCAWLD